MNNSNNTSPTAISGGRRLKNDLILIAVLLVAVSVAGLLFFLFRGEGDTVTVTRDGVLIGEYPLSVPLTLTIGEGDSVNILVIEDGHAHVSEATCPDGICAAHRPISRNGESIVCLPNKVVVTVKTSDGGAPDIVA